MNKSDTGTMTDFAYWQNKELYTQLMQNFINDIIDGPQFEKEFYEIWRLDCDKSYRYEEMLELDNEKLLESKGFADLISNLFMECDVFEPDPSLREDDDISEIELKNYVKKTLLEIKDRYP